MASSLRHPAPAATATSTDDTVYFQGDGERLSPEVTARLLADYVSTQGVTPDSYSRGGTVEQLERAMAAALGKEAALFVPTGTLANHLAIRRHCATRGQALVPEQSHVYLDTGDSIPRLSGIHLVPLAPGRPGPTTEEVRASLDRPASDRVPNPPGAVVLESPVRRQLGRVIPFDQMQAIAALCRDRGVPIHLDGARLYMMSAATGIPITTYTALFDTVYVSLCKYLGAPFGAILAGPQSFIDGLHHDRRMFGGSLPAAWMAAALVLHTLDGFEERFAAAMSRFRLLLPQLNRLEGLRAAPLPDGSNIIPLHLDPAVHRDTFTQRLREHGIVLPAGSPHDAGDPVLLTVNTTILRQEPDHLLAGFAAALSQSRHPVTVS